MDCSDGSTYKNNLLQMEQKYIRKFGDVENKPVMVNILLGQFYDGCAIFKKRYSILYFGRLILLY